MKRGLLGLSRGLLLTVALGAGCGGDAATSTPGQTGTSAAAGDTGASGGSGGATGGSGGVGGDPVVEPRSMLAACRAYIRAACDRRYECGIMPSTAGCAENYWYQCPDYVFAPGSQRTVDGMFACAEEYATFDCEQLSRNITPPCALAGAAEAGEPCVSPIQCSSLSCTAVNVGCGSCKQAVGVGEACNPELEACPLGYTCQDTCVESPVITNPPPEDRAVGEACNRDDRCPEGYLCPTRGYDLEGVCQLPRQLGEACTAAGTLINTCIEIAYCDLQSSVCIPKPVAGETCGFDGTSTIPCAPGYDCDGAVSFEDQGICVAQLPAGSACDEPSDYVTPSRGGCLTGLVCAPDGICREMIPEGYACPDPGELAFCEVRTSCVDGVCTADDTLAKFQLECAEP